MLTLLLPAPGTGTHSSSLSSAAVRITPTSTATVRRHYLNRLPPFITSLPNHRPENNIGGLVNNGRQSPLDSIFRRSTGRLLSVVVSSSVSPTNPYPSPGDDAERAKLAQVAKRLESTSRYFRRLGNLGFWCQLVCTVVAATILSFSVVVTGKITSPATFYATAGGIAAAFISIFWSFGYIRLSEKLRKTANDPSKAPPRADVVRSLKNGIVLNLLGMGATILGLQATVGLLVAKALTTSTNPYYQGIPPGSSPVLALDVFLVQASANTILSHFLGLVFSLELLRSVTLPTMEAIPVPRVA